MLYMVIAKAFVKRGDYVKYLYSECFLFAANSTDRQFLYDIMRRDELVVYPW